MSYVGLCPLFALHTFRSEPDLVGAFKNVSARVNAILSAAYALFSPPFRPNFGLKTTAVSFW